MRLKLVFVVIFGAFCVAGGQKISCDYKDTIVIDGGKKDGKGNYVYREDIYKPGDYAHFKYKLVNFTTKVLTDPHIRGCVCKLKPCIRICCLKGDDCAQPKELTFPYDGSEIKINFERTKIYGVLAGRPCEHLYKLDTEVYEDEDAWTLHSNGSIETDNKVYDTDSYCFSQTNGSEKAEAYICYNEEERDSHLKYYPIGMILSIPFLLLTLIVYASIPELRNLHGKCLMCYVCGLIVFYISLAIIQFNSHGLGDTACAAIGYVLYVSVLFCFVWLNIMCYDIWFVSRNGLTRVFKSFENSSFVLYAIYGFGSPIFIAILVFTVDIFELLPVHYSPQFGVRRCWLQDSRLVEAIYVYIPMSILIAINIALFLMTARTIWKAQQIARAEDDQTLVKETVLRSRFYIYLRLFIIMGLTWFMESCSWMFQNSSVFFVVADIFNCLQGVFIFIICVLNLSTRQLIVRRCFPLGYIETSTDEPDSRARKGTSRTTVT